MSPSKSRQFPLPHLALLFLLLFQLESTAQKSILFDGINDYALCNHHSDFNFDKNDFTIEAQISNFNSTGYHQAIYSKQSVSGGLEFGIDSLGNLYVIIGTTKITDAGNSKINDGCHHIAVSRENGIISFYLDGQNYTASGSYSIDVDNSSAVNIGRNNNGTKYFYGNLEELRIWNISKSTSQIDDISSNCIIGNESNLIAYWIIESQSQVLDDASLNHHNARLGNTFFADEADPQWSTDVCYTVCCNAEADFLIDNPMPLDSQTVNFTNTSNNALSYQWIVNGNVESTNTDFDFNFPIGTHIIQLVAFGDYDCRNFKTWVLTVSLPTHPCVSNEYMQWRSINDTNYLKSLQTFNKVTNEIVGQNYISLSPDSIYRIPVVFHIISDDSSVLTSFDTSRIEAQLTLLNNEFANNNTNIVFCLAQNLPTGITQTQWTDFSAGSMIASPGITYTFTSNSNLLTFDAAALNHTVINNALPFPPEQYLNIYIVKNATVPNQPSAVGFASIGPSYNIVDGVVVEQSAFRLPANGTAIIGRTLVHEVGHWLGLRHVFSANGNGDDYVCDTYPQTNPTSTNSILGCSSAYSISLPSCIPTAITYFQGENHMDYHTENCLSKFTNGQIDRMHATLDYGRPFIHNTINLVNTGIQQIGSNCYNISNVVADFLMSANGICNNSLNPINLNGANVNYSSWQWNVSWNPSNNNNLPAPSGAFTVTPQSGSGQPIASLNINAPGNWDIILQVTHNGTTVVDTQQLQVIDCTPNAERNRITSIYNDNDINLSYVSIDNLNILSNDSARYIVSGSSLDINTQEPESGVLICLDETGHTLWRKSIGLNNERIRLFDITSNITFNQNSNCHALTGLITRSGNSELLFMIVDRTGNSILFQESYPITASGTQFDYAVGLQVVQLSSNFNNEFAIVGFAGNGKEIEDNKVGFVIGINPTLSNGNRVRWIHFYESTAPQSSQNDFDIVENILEMAADFGSGLEPVLVVGGNMNMSTYGNSATFLSCLSITGQTVTENWRNNFEAFANGGTIDMIASVFENGRLFSACFSDYSHGTFIFELVPSTGILLSISENQDFRGYELILDGNQCVISGIDYNSRSMAAIKMELPLIGSSSWPASGSDISRQYFESSLIDSWGEEHNPRSYISKPQNLVKSPNGGYMIVHVTDFPLINSTGLSPYQLIANKVDDLLVSACNGESNYSIGALLTLLSDPLTATSFSATVTEASTSASLTNKNELCNITNCTAPFTVSIVTLPDTCPNPLGESAAAVPNNGYLPYSYLWSNNQTTAIATGLMIGNTYQLTVTDRCSTQATVSIVIPDHPFGFSQSITQPCSGNNTTGSIDLTMNGNYSAPYSFYWSNSSTTEDQSGLSSGSYSVTVTDSNGCKIIKTAVIQLTNCACSGTADEDITIFNWGNNFNLTANTLYALGANVTVSGSNLVLNDAVISIAPSISISIDSGAVLTLDHCHLYACDSMWQGIVVKPGGRLIVKNASLIEDAKFAIDIQNHNSTAPILEIDETIFNRNYIAVNIKNYQQNIANYPFEITNSVFTSRNLSFTVNSWPLPVDLETLINTGDLDEHYDMDSFSTIGRKAPYNNDQVCAGIYLDGVGAFNSGTYRKILLDGDNGTGTFNLFDNLMYAVIGTNSNISATNNVFQLLPRHSSWNFGGRGIAVQNTNVPAQHCMIELSGNNRFYDCVVGVDVDGYNDILIENTNMRSSQMPVSSIPNEGEIGIYISSAYLDTLSISFDTITNIRNGIVFLGTGIGSPTQEQIIGPMTFSNNIIQATLDGYSGNPSNEYVLNGIIVDNTVLNAFSQAQNYSPIIIQNNKLYQVHNGIHTQNWRYDTESYFNNKIYTTDNYISLRQIIYPNSTPQPQFGIRHELNEAGQIQNNTVDGFDNSYEGWYGIMADDIVNTATPSVICNTTTLTGTGIIFSQPSNIYFFLNNTMNNNQYGYVLDGAAIDVQGSNSSACGNQWINYSSGFKTYTMNGADPLNSILWIDDSDPYQDPTGFNFSDIPPTFIYDISNGLEPVNSNGNNTNCSAPQNRMSNTGTSQSSGYAITNTGLDSLILIALLEEMVTDSFVHHPFPDAAISMAKQRAYSILNSSPSLTNSSSVLQNFYAQAQLNNTRVISNIEDAIAQNNLQQAVSLLNNLQPQNNVESNSKSYLLSYLHYRLGTFNMQDSLELLRLSNGCVARDGYSVTKARSLYRLLSNNFSYFFDDCGSIVQPRSSDISITESSKMMLYPNPNNGDFVIKSTESGYALLFIYSIDGKLVYQHQIKDISGERINLLLNNGLYLISIRTEKKLYTTKLTINNQ